MKCWGSSLYGQIGNGTSGVSWLGAVDVCASGSGIGCANGAPLAGVAAIEAGDRHTCALMQDASVKCWGYNHFGQLGNGASGDEGFSSLPVGVAALAAVDIAAGGMNSCAITTDTTLKCWGNNFNGQLGIGVFPNVPLSTENATCPQAAVPDAACVSVPVDVEWPPGVPPNGIWQIETADTTCSLRFTGLVQCWGLNSDGQVGNGTTTPANPDALPSLPNFPEPNPQDVMGAGNADGLGDGCAQAGAVIRCWGQNTFGQVGDGTLTHRATPAAVTGIPAGIFGLEDSDGTHNCVNHIDESAIYCWGLNASRQLGAPSQLCNEGTVIELSCSPFAIKVQFGFVVNETGDQADADLDDGLCDHDLNVRNDQCSLRAAIDQANHDPGADDIAFAIPGDGFHAILPASPLPPITDPAVIDATSQPGYTSLPLIDLDGTNAGPSAGLVIRASGSEVHGLSINRFASTGIWIDGVDGATVEKNIVGLDVSGNDFGNGADGVLISGDNNVVRDNVLSGNALSGLAITGIPGVGDGFAQGNVVLGNRIGTDDASAAGRKNDLIGVLLINAFDTLIGGASVGEGNVISGNGDPASINPDAGRGVLIRNSGRNSLLGNRIGTDLSGNQGVGNAEAGIEIRDSTLNVIGGTATGSGNVISTNLSDGVRITGALSTSNRVSGNLIGTAGSGTGDFGNTGAGVFLVDSSARNVIGEPGGRNVIAGNDSVGIAILQSDGNIVRSNYVGINAAGGALGNTTGGVALSSGADRNVIGGTDAGAGNVISANGTLANGRAGINVFFGASENEVLGNYIGTDPTGTITDPDGVPSNGDEFGNAGSGVRIATGTSNIIGGPVVGARNVISGNGESGISITGAAVEIGGNKVLGNYIGLDASGIVDLGNGDNGVEVAAGLGPGVTNTLIADNAISGNGGSGVFIVAAHGNQLSGNRIGTDALGGATPGLGNTGAGVLLNGSADNIVGDPAAARNVIAGNGGTGIVIIGPDSTGNRVLHSHIGLVEDGTKKLANLDGVEISDGASSNIVGGLPSLERNAISGNRFGVLVAGGATDNQVIGNSIGVDAGGNVFDPDGVPNSGDELGNTVGVRLESAINTRITQNTISGNTVGVAVRSSPTLGVSMGNELKGNRIGVSFLGMDPLPNSLDGVLIDGGANTTIGGTGLTDRNVISANRGAGVRITSDSSFGNQVLGNLIGLDSALRVRAQSRRRRAHRRERARQHHRRQLAERRKRDLQQW